MMGKLLLLLSVGYLAFAPLKSHKAEDDSKMIEGTWIPVTAELAGQKLPDRSFRDVKGARLVLAAGRYTYENDEGAYKLIPAQEPGAAKAMDITGTAGPNKGKTLLAIYELAGDTLRICYDLEGKSRPEEFTTHAGTHQFLVIYKRAKAK